MAKSKGGDGEVSQMSLVRDALEALGYDAKPAAIDAHIKENHNGREVPKAIISSYKSLLKNKKKKGGGVGKPGRKPGGGGGGLKVEDLAAVRGLVSRLGAAQVKQLVDVLA